MTNNQPATKVHIPIEDLPAWMQRAYRGTDWGALFALLLGLLSAWAFLFYPSISRNNDLEHYVFRAADVGEAIREGRLYPRWSPYAQNGYGAPIAHFSPPLPAYLAGALDTLFVNDPALAVRLVMAGAMVAASGAVYAFVSRRTNAGAGLLATLLYVYSPYVGSIAPHVSGDYPAVLANALIPTLFWALDGALLLGRPRDVSVLALTVAALLLTHIPVTTSTFVFGAAFLIWHITQRQFKRSKWLMRTAIVSGVMLAAFYWLPAAGEAQWVVWGASSHSDIERIDLLRLLSPYRTIDPSALVSIPQYTLGIPLIAFAIISLIVFVCRFGSVARRAFAGFFFIGGIIMALLVVQFTPTFVWSSGSLSFCFAVAGACTFDLALNALRARNPRKITGSRIALPLTAAFLLALSAPVWLIPPPISTNEPFTPEAQIQYEQLGYGIAVLPDSEPLPAALPPQTSPNINVTGRTQADSLTKIEIANESIGNRDGARAGTIDINSHSYNLQVRTIASTRFQVLTTYFPGWAITSSAVNATLAEDENTGLIALNVAGDSAGELIIELASTPLRSLGWFSTWTAAVIIFLLTQRRAHIQDETTEMFPMLSKPEVRLTAIVILAFGIMLRLMVLPDAPFPLSARLGTELDGSFELRTRTDVGLETLAYRTDRATYRPGDRVEFTLYWRTIQPLDVNYRIQPTLIVRNTGETLQRGDLNHPGGYPTRRWLTDYFVPDQHVVWLSPNTPAGEYWIGLEVYDCAPGNECTQENRITFFNTTGENLGKLLVLPIIITVEP